MLWNGCWKLDRIGFKRIHAITDVFNGKLYIGLAYGNDCLLNRWSSYVNNLTGGNVELKKVLEEKGKEYIQTNFKYSILKIFDTKTKQEYILERENYWKKVFETKKFGMNKN